MTKQTALQALKAGKRLQFQADNPDLKRGVRSAVAKLKQQGYQARYSLELRNDEFVYLVHVTKKKDKP
jgi:uncharacterized linocin/CFP29 family protein